MNLTSNDLAELKSLQPELVLINNKINGCFYLSARKTSSRRGSKKLEIFPWNLNKPKSDEHLIERFYIDAKICEDGRLSVFEISEKLLSWKDNIPEEFWHINSDGSLCLGVKTEMLNRLKIEQSFAQYFNFILTNYFYYMSYLNHFGTEPWEAHRHGLFAALEIATKDIELFWNLSIAADDYGRLEKIFDKSKYLPLKLNDHCPFCTAKVKVYSCSKHKKQIKGYNKAVKSLEQ